MHALSSLLLPKAKPVRQRQRWLIENALELPAGYEQYVAMNSTGVRANGGAAQLERHDSCSSMKDMRLA